MNDDSGYGKKNGYTIRPLLERNPASKEYHEAMAKAQLAERGPAKPKPVCPPGTTKEEWYASMQAPSTKAIMDGTYKDKYDISKWEANAHLKREDFDSDDAFWKAKTGERSVSADEIMAYKAHQRRSKNTLGQSEESAFSQESRERAAHHFVVSPAAILSEAEMQSVHKLTAPAKGIPASIQFVTKKLSPIGAFFHWLRGGKVWQEKE